MYTYKFVPIKHSMWTGKPKERIEAAIQEHAENGWRLVQVLQDHSAMWYTGRIKTKIIFEKPATADLDHHLGEKLILENELV